MSPRLLIGSILAAALILLAFQPAEAIPAFARKHKISCSTCHAPFPRLKEFGEEFAGRGFRMPAGQEPARATYDVGDPLLELQRRLPLAVRIDGFAAWNEDATAEADFEWPWVFKVMSGGPLGKKYAYYFYFIIEEGEVEGLEDAYFQANSIGGLPLDLMFGQFQVSDPLFKRELRLERLDYEIYKVMVGESLIRLTYDQGIMGVWHAPAGFEVVFEILNGNGLDDPDEEIPFDRDSKKNFALRAVRNFGPVRAGLFGYYGEEESAGGRENRSWFLGPDLAFDLTERWKLNLQYLERRDSEPFFAGPLEEDFVTRGGFLEAHFLPGGADGRWAYTGLYNKVVSDDPLAERESFALSSSYLLARNIRLLVEAARDFEHSATQASIGLITAF